MSLSPKKLALIHVAVVQLGMQDEDYRALLRRVAGVASSKDLDDTGFDALVTEFARLGFRRSEDLGRNAGGAGMATRPQLAKIRQLWRAYTGRTDDKGLSTWLEKHFHVTHPRFLYIEQAGKCIPILDHMAKAKAAKQCAPRTA